MARKSLETDITDLVQALGGLVRRLRSVDSSQARPWAETIVLKRLAVEGPATGAELAREVGVKPQSMGATLAALTDLGMVERKPHATDGRRIMIALTPKGVAEHKHAREARRSWLAERVAQLSEKEQETLFAAGAIMKRLAQA